MINRRIATAILLGCFSIVAIMVEKLFLLTVVGLIALGLYEFLAMI